MMNIDFSQLKGSKARDYAIRFLFGGVVSVCAELIAKGTTDRFGGIFTAFPAILLASLTIIGGHENKDAAAADAHGGVLGAIALVTAAIVLSVTLERLPGAWSLLLTLVVWLACALGLYLSHAKLSNRQACQDD